MFVPWRMRLDDHLFPIQAFFNAVGDAEFVRVVEHLSRGIGAGVNEADCAFPGDLDPGDEPFEGVRFSIFEESIIISTSELRGYLRFACEQYLVEHPEDELILTECLARPIR